MSFQIGETVGRYRVVEQLGQGGMATVYKAYHAELDRYVALKVLHPAFLEDKNFLARFQREARLVAKLDHPNIVPIYDYSEHEGRPYLVMKFVTGETLKARLSQGNIPPAQLSTIVEAVGAALSFAHVHGILHRDIKPSNVLLAEDGQIYLADFGLARIAQAGESTLTSDMILGTPQYISPEQALGKKNLDEGTDIYSFGVMLYEMTVGRVPFSADTPFSIIHDHIYTPLPMPHTVNPAVPEDVERVLLKALAKEREDRFIDVKSLVAAFTAAWSVVDATMVTGPEGEKQNGENEAATLPPSVPPGQSSIKTLVQEASQAPVLKGSGRKPKKVPWMWLAIAVIAVLSCVFIYIFIRATRPFRNPQLQPTAQIVQVVTGTKAEMSPLEKALEEAETNPDDAGAQLRLALAYQQAKNPGRAQESLDRVLALAANDEEFLWNGARTAAGDEAWLCAARLSLEASLLHREKEEILPDDMVTLLHETIYKAVKDPLFKDYVFNERLKTLDEALFLLVEARYTFLFSSRPRGQEMLDELLRRKPNYNEGLLLQADFSARSGDNERTQSILQQIKSTPDVPEWILHEAEIIEGMIP